MSSSQDPFYTQIFKDEFHKRMDQSSRAYDQDTLHLIAETHLQNLTDIPGVYFDSDTKEFISLAAARHLAEALRDQTSLMEAWAQVQDSFLKNKYWGFTTHSEEQSPQRINPSRELFSYIWVMVQALLIMKVVIFYFGLKSAEDTSSGDTFWLVLAISFSFFSLFFFAWRKSRKKKRKP